MSQITVITLYRDGERGRGPKHYFVGVVPGTLTREQQEKIGDSLKLEQDDEVHFAEVELGKIDNLVPISANGIVGTY